LSVGFYFAFFAPLRFFVLTVASQKAQRKSFNQINLGSYFFLFEEAIHSLRYLRLCGFLILTEASQKELT
jgi:hypothetical protein